MTGALQGGQGQEAAPGPPPGSDQPSVSPSGTQLSQAIIHQYYHPVNLPELFGTILPLDLEDIFKKSKPRYHKRTSSAVWNSPPLQGTRVPSSLAYSLKKY